MFKKTGYNTKITEIENKIPDVTGLVASATLNTKATEIESKISNTTNLATKAALNTKAIEIENKTTDTSTLVRKRDYNTNIAEIEDKIPDASNFDKKLKSINRKVISNKARQLHTKTKLSEHKTSIKKLTNSLTKEIGLILTKELKKKLKKWI